MRKGQALLLTLLFSLISFLPVHAQEYVKISGEIQLPENTAPQPNEVIVSLGKAPGADYLAKASVKVNQRFELFAPKNQPLYLFVSTSYAMNDGNSARMAWRSEKDSYLFTSDKDLVIKLPLLTRIQGTLEDASGQPITGMVTLGLGWFSDKKILANDGILWTLEGGQRSYTGVTKNGSFVLYGGQNAMQTLRVESSGLDWKSWYFSSTSDTSVRVCLPINFSVNRELSKECLVEWSIGLTAFEAEIKARKEAEAKAKTEAPKKKITITCVKGKSAKKVTAVNPKCPKGYKKK